MKRSKFFAGLVLGMLGSLAAVSDVHSGDCDKLPFEFIESIYSIPANAHTRNFTVTKKSIFTPLRPGTYTSGDGSYAFTHVYYKDGAIVRQSDYKIDIKPGGLITLNQKSPNGDTYLGTVPVKLTHKYTNLPSQSFSKTMDLLCNVTLLVGGYNYATLELRVPAFQSQPSYVYHVRFRMSSISSPCPPSSPTAGKPGSGL